MDSGGGEWSVEGIESGEWIVDAGEWRVKNGGWRV